MQNKSIITLKHEAYESLYVGGLSLPPGDESADERLLPIAKYKLSFAYIKTPEAIRLYIIHCAALPPGGAGMIMTFVHETPGGGIVLRPRKLRPTIHFQSGMPGTRNM
jgi:hypothetical protein